jgi:hypothetical protein
MSYDITFVDRRPDQDWDDALQAAETRAAADEPLDETRRHQWEEIERRVRTILGDVDSGVQDTVGELAHSGTGLQVALFAHEAAVSYPYWDHADRQAFHRQVADVVAAVEEVTGLSAYDPQTERAFDGTPDDAAGLAARGLLDRPDDASRARRYLFVGALVTLGSVVYLLTVRSSFLIVLALVIGLVDLAVGVHLWRRSRSDA